MMKRIIGIQTTNLLVTMTNSLKMMAPAPQETALVKDAARYVSHFFTFPSAGPWIGSASRIDHQLIKVSL